MKIAPAQLRTPLIVAETGMVHPIWAKWLQQVVDSPMREVSTAEATPTAPEMKPGELIVFKATALAKTYLVYYDGTNRFYWESTGTDLY